MTQLIDWSHNLGKAKTADYLHWIQIKILKKLFSHRKHLLWMIATLFVFPYCIPSQYFFINIFHWIPSSILIYYYLIKAIPHHLLQNPGDYSMPNPLNINSSQPTQNLSQSTQLVPTRTLLTLPETPKTYNETPKTYNETPKTYNETPKTYKRSPDRQAARENSLQNAQFIISRYNFRASNLTSLEWIVRFYARVSELNYRLQKTHDLNNPLIINQTNFYDAKDIIRALQQKWFSKLNDGNVKFTTRYEELLYLKGLQKLQPTVYKEFLHLYDQAEEETITPYRTANNSGYQIAKSTIAELRENFKTTYILQQAILDRRVNQIATESQFIKERIKHIYLDSLSYYSNGETLETHYSKEISEASELMLINNAMQTLRISWGTDDWVADVLIPRVETLEKEADEFKRKITDFFSKMPPVPHPKEASNSTDLSTPVPRPRAIQ